MKSSILSFLNGDLEPSLKALALEHLAEADNKNDKKSDTNKVEVWIPTGPNFFEKKLTKELTHHVFDFLDPFSLGTAGIACKRFYEISTHPLLFKKFCRKLYLQYPPLPFETPFNALLIRINSAALGEFHPSFIAQANQDIRNVVWVPSLKSFYTPPSYYKQFKNMRAVYLNAPRVQFGGVYVMKEQYIRVGAKDFRGYYDPYHAVDFYRYIRFFPTGLVMSSLSVNKLKDDKIIRIFSENSELLGQDGEAGNNQDSGLKSLMQGEYIVQKSIIHIRLNAKTTIYQYELEIGSSVPGLFDQLKMLSQSMRSVGSDYNQPFPSHSNGKRHFKFVKVKGFLDELDDDIACVSS